MIPPRHLAIVWMILLSLGIIVLSDTDQVPRTYAKGVANRVDYLLGRLESADDYKVRIAAAQELGKIANGTLADWMLRAFRKEKNKAVRLTIVYSLGQIPDHRVIPPLLELAHEEFLDQPELVAIERVVWNLRRAVSVLDWSRAILDSKYRSERALGAYVLGLVGDATTLPVLTKAVRDKNSIVRMRAVQALGRIGSKKAAEICNRTFNQDRDRSVKRAARTCVGQSRLLRTGKLPRRHRRRIRLKADLYGLKHDRVTPTLMRKYLRNNVNPRALDRALVYLQSPSKAEKRVDRTTSLGSRSWIGKSVRLKVRMDSPGRFGGRHLAKMRALVKGKAGNVHNCYLKALTKNRRLGGTVNVKFLVLSTGHISTIDFTEGTLQDAAVQRCIRDELRRIDFPSVPLRYVILRYSYSFVPPKDQRIEFKRGK